MDKLAALTAFTAVVRAGGFAAAARELGQSRSAVNRLVIQLEEDLGAQLLNRTTRQVAPTATGLAYHDRALAILSAIEDADQAVCEERAEPRGILRINAPMSFGTMHLAPAIADFLKRYPKLKIQITLNDRFVDLIAEGFDLTVRIAQPQEDANIVDHRLCEIRLALCASPDYLAKYGRPEHPKDLAQYPCLFYGHMADGNHWKLKGPDGTHAVRITGPLCSNNGEVLLEAALSGLGIGLLPTFIIGAELQNGRLVTLMPDYYVTPLSLCAVYPTGRHLSPAIRHFTDFLQERFEGAPYWDLTL